MTIETYFAIALISLETDALFCMTRGAKFRIGWAMFFAAIWPLTAIVVVVCAAIGARMKPTTRKSAT